MNTANLVLIVVGVLALGGMAAGAYCYLVFKRHSFEKVQGIFEQKERTHHLLMKASENRDRETNQMVNRLEGEIRNLGHHIRSIDDTLRRELSNIHNCIAHIERERGGK